MTLKHQVASCTSLSKRRGDHVPYAAFIVQLVLERCFSQIKNRCESRIAPARTLGVRKADQATCKLRCKLIDIPSQRWKREPYCTADKLGSFRGQLQVFQLPASRQIHVHVLNNAQRTELLNLVEDPRPRREVLACCFQKLHPSGHQSKLSGMFHTVGEAVCLHIGRSSTRHHKPLMPFFYVTFVDHHRIVHAIFLEQPVAKALMEDRNMLAFGAHL
mmetsp:Transcript_19992/g.75506  ORF Transcript_19992/g.75506 Transcript_19992/m.75506 type:complete len:217 (-) Transcript_19992:2524-3174(-)